MQINGVIAAIIILSGYLGVPYLILRIRNPRWQRCGVIIATVLFLIVVSVGVFAKVKLNGMTLSITWDWSGTWAGKKMQWDVTQATLGDIALNLVFLYPIGMVVAYVLNGQRWWVQTLVLTGVGLLTGVIIECGQLLLPIARAPQLSDIICNTISVLLGAPVYQIYRKIA